MCWWALVLIKIYLFLINSSYQFSTVTLNKPKSSPLNWRRAEDPHHVTEGDIILYSKQGQQNSLGIISSATVKHHGLNQDWVCWDFKQPMRLLWLQMMPWEQQEVKDQPLRAWSCFLGQPCSKSKLCQGKSTTCQINSSKTSQAGKSIRVNQFPHLLCSQSKKSP